MKRFLTLAAAAMTLAGCAAIKSLHNHAANKDSNPYAKPLFVEKYLDPANNALDAQIRRTIDALRARPDSAALHNQLGQLLVQKGFPKDAEREFERAVDADRTFYPAWYNFGLMRMARGNTAGAHVAFLATVHYKPGHSQALFQLGLMEEERGHEDAAIDYYTKALEINLRGYGWGAPNTLLDVRTNPRLLDSKLLHLALLKLYPKDHARDTMKFVGTPPGYAQQKLEAPSPQPSGQEIVTPSAPLTDPARQATPQVPATPPKPPM